MEIVFTSSYKTYFKDNTRNFDTNYYVLIFLISVIFFIYNMRQREYLYKPKGLGFGEFSPILYIGFVLLYLLTLGISEDFSFILQIDRNQ